MEAGGTGVLAVEKSADAFRTLWHNLARPRGLPGYNWPSGIPAEAADINVMLSAHRAAIESLRGSVDLVAGGPPCQGFSTYGKRNPHDKRNHLWKAYLKFVELVEPRAVLLENVEGIDMPFVSGRKDSSKQCRETAAVRIIKELKRQGFTTTALRLCASDYGVPQFRPRFFLVGLRLPRPVELESQVCDALLARIRQQHLADLGLTLGKKITVKQAISDLEIQGKRLTPCPDSKRFNQAPYTGPMSAYQRSMHEGMDSSTPPNSIRLANHKAPTVEKFKKIQALGVRGYKAAARINAVLGTSKHRVHWLNPGKPAPTITTLPDDFVHYSEPRILTVRECARLQSFPDWFEFQGKYTTGGERRKRECPRFTQVGNAVPPRLARFLGLFIEEALSVLAEDLQPLAA